MIKNINIWYISSLLVTLIVAIPIITIFSSFFSVTSDYYILLKNTFLLNYISNSIILLSGVLFLTAFFGITAAYLVSFFNFPGANFFKWSLILFLLGFRPIKQFFIKLFIESDSKFIEFILLISMIGLKAFNSKCP